MSFPQHPEWQTVYDFAWSNWKRLILNNRKMYNQCWMDEGFGAGGATWQWDTNFGSIGARWGFTEFPVIETQENFYFAQQANGLIGQKLSEQSESFKATSLNPPFYAWVEWEYYLMTGDASHFTKVINGVPVYQRLRNHFYYFWNNACLHKADGSWVWSGIDSGRDCVSAGLWVDLPAQLARSAKVSRKNSDHILLAADRSVFCLFKTVFNYSRFCHCLRMILLPTVYASSSRTKSKTPMPETIRTADHTWMILNQMPNFQQFFRDYLGILKTNLQQVSVMGEDGKERYRYYTCGQDHDPRNPASKPFQHMMRYCQELGFDFDEARDMVQERIGRKLGCECELLRS